MSQFKIQITANRMYSADCLELLCRVIWRFAASGFLGHKLVRLNQGPHQVTTRTTRPLDWQVLFQKLNLLNSISSTESYVWNRHCLCSGRVIRAKVAQPWSSTVLSTTSCGIIWSNFYPDKKFLFWTSLALKKFNFLKILFLIKFVKIWSFDGNV